MATLRTFLLFVTICIVTLVRAKKESLKYFKARKFPFAYPVGVCYPRQVDADFVSSIKLVCQEDPTDCPEDGSECNRMMVAQRYDTDDCTGSIQSWDRFREDSFGQYPFRCYEQREIDDPTFTAAPDEYETSYVVVKMTRGLEIVEEVDAGNVTSCEADPDADFYRTFPAITDRCIMGWRDIDGVNTPEWHLTRCTETAVEVLTFDKKRSCTNYNDALDVNGTDFTELVQPNNTLYSENGCDDREWEGSGPNSLWYTEVLECTHPDYTISGAVYTSTGVYMLVAMTLVLYVL